MDCFDMQPTALPVHLWLIVRASAWSVSKPFAESPQNLGRWQKAFESNCDGEIGYMKALI